MKRDCYQYALLLLGIRARTEKELTAKLLKKNFDKPQVEECLTKLKNYNLINDKAYAESFARSGSRRLSGENLIRIQLLNKGISSDIIKEVFADRQDIEDELSKAKKLSAKYLKTNKSKLKEKAQAKLAYFLARKGFAPNVIYKVTKFNLEEDTEII